MQFSTELTICDIQEWIKSLFSDDVDIPEFQENSECMKLISSIICLDKEAKKDYKEIIKVDLHLAECYVEKKNEICKMFNLDILPDDISPSFSECVENIAFRATQMKLKDLSLTNFLLSSAYLENKKEDYSKELTLIIFNQSKLSKKISNIMEKNSDIEKKMDFLKKNVSKNQVFKLHLPERYKFIKVKIEEYKKRIKKMQNVLKGVGWTSSLSHKELMKRAEKIHALEKEVKIMTDKLKSYQNLPPNEMLAQLKVEEAKANLLQLQNKTASCFTFN